MGRSVFIEENLEDRILKLFGETKWASGILIGQVRDIRLVYCDFDANNSLVSAVFVSFSSQLCKEIMLSILL